MVAVTFSPFTTFSHIDGPEFDDTDPEPPPALPPNTPADLITGTIWNIYPQPMVPALLPGNQVVVAGLTVGADVPANGLLAILYVDTTGWGPDDDPWELKMAPGTTVDPHGTELIAMTGPFPTPIPLVITNGMIWVPEPSSIAMLVGLLAIIPLLACRRRRS